MLTQDAFFLLKREELLSDICEKNRCDLFESQPKHQRYKTMMTEEKICIMD